MTTNHEVVQRTDIRRLVGLTMLCLVPLACANVNLVAVEVPRIQQEEHARYDFPVVIDGHELVLTYEGTHDVTQESDAAVRLVVFVHHGGRQNAVSYFQRIRAALDEAAADRPDLALQGTTMVVAPAMIGQHHINDHPERYSTRNYPYWSGDWREGANSVNQPAVSNYDLLDGMMLHIADRFPGVRAIVQVGHSAGGQLVSRYSVGTPVFDDLRSRGVALRFIIASPSSFLYLDRHRPDLDAGAGFVDYTDAVPIVAGSECPYFNVYKHGLEQPVPYMTRRTAEVMVSGFQAREVFILQGAQDNDPDAEGLERSCGAMVQGRHRVERGVRYYEYWGHLFGPEIYENKFLAVVPGVGHNSSQLFLSAPARGMIFIDADSAATAIGG